MSADPRPLVVLSEPIHQDGHALLASEARVAVCQGPPYNRRTHDADR